MRPGFGERDPAVVAALAPHRPAAVEPAQWGQTKLRLSGYLAPWPGVPDRYVTSVRCLTSVGEQVLLCQVPAGVHFWPGGRLEAGETVEDTAIREVAEETGWLVRRGSVRQVGLLHFEHLDLMPADHPWPHPDFFQAVVTCTADQHRADPDTWVDTEGEVLRSWLADEAEVAALPLSPVERAFATWFRTAATGAQR